MITYSKILKIHKFKQNECSYRKKHQKSVLISMVLNYCNNTMNFMIFSLIFILQNAFFLPFFVIGNWKYDKSEGYNDLTNFH